MLVVLSSNRNVSKSTIKKIGRPLLLAMVVQQKAGCLSESAQSETLKSFASTAAELLAAEPSRSLTLLDVSLTVGYRQYRHYSREEGCCSHAIDSVFKLGQFESVAKPPSTPNDSGSRVVPHDCR